MSDAPALVILYVLLVVWALELAWLFWRAIQISRRNR